MGKQGFENWGENTVGLLGPVVAFGHELSTRPRRQQAVFVVLATRPGQVVTTEQLIRAVWPATAPDSAAARIRSDIAGLRRLVREAGLTSREVIASTPHGYALRLEPREVDVWRFEKLFRRGTAAASLGDHLAAAEAYSDALELWRGEPLAGVPGPYAERERTRLAERELTATEELIRAKSRVSSGDDLAAELSHLVRLHPERESLRELLMITLARSGRRAEALLAFQDTRRTLSPGPRLLRIRDRILADDSAFIEAS